MKKLSLRFLLMTGLLVSLFVACDDDEDGPTDPTAPNIATLTPDEGPVGTTVVIAGTNFGTGATVSFGGTAVTPTNPSDVSLTVEVPTGLSGEVNVTVTSDGQTSNQQTFEVTEGGGDETPEPTMATIADTLETAADGSLTSLNAAVEAAGLTDALSGSDSITIFAPNNAAFDALIAETDGVEDLTGLVEALGTETLAGILQAHVVEGAIDATEATAAAGGDPLETLNEGSTITITQEGENLLVNGAQVITPNIMTGNGIIHIIDAVINTDATGGGGETTRVDISDEDLVAGETYNWTADNEYFLTGLVFVGEGATLNIEEGTVVRFTEETGGDNTSALIVTQGAQINAVGTPQAPIIFTAEADTVGSGLLPTDWGLWGGVILLGNAPAEKGGVTADISIEGVDSDETRAVYGGDDPADNSGTLQYVSIRYTGVGIAPNSEIQGLTLGGVGNGTTIDHIDIYSSNDDGIEIFGGTVNISYASVAFATDDAFDFDEGWRGSIQFGFAIQTDADYDQVGEWDGSDPDDGQSLTAAPNLYNFTLIGPGQDATGAQRALIMRDAFAGKLGNSIIEDFPGIGIQVEDVDGDVDSYNYITNPIDGGFQVEILNNTWAQFGGYSEDDGLSSLVEATEVVDDQGTEDESDDVVTFTGVTDDVVAELTDNANDYSASAIVASISRATDGGLDPRPAATTAATTTVPTGLEQVDYRGAFAPGEATWLAGWSTLSQEGILFE